jgi:hypothetical protein
MQKTTAEDDRYAINSGSAKQRNGFSAQRSNCACGTSKQSADAQADGHAIKETAATVSAFQDIFRSSGKGVSPSCSCRT